MMTDWYTDPL